MMMEKLGSRQKLKISRKIMKKIGVGACGKENLSMIKVKESV